MAELVNGGMAEWRNGQAMLYGVGPNDPATFVMVLALLALVGVVASWAPARRASRVNPIVALRSE